MQRRNIMIVEDEVIVSADLQMKLENLGCKVCGIIRYGEDVFESVLKHSPDLVLMDIVLKGKMDGIEAAMMIFDRLKMPVVFLTAFSDDATLERAKKAQPLGYIRKPFSEEDLRINIEIALHKMHLEKRLRDSEERLDLAIRGAHAGLWDWHVKTGKTVFNERWAGILGYQLKELEPSDIRTWISLCHPDDLINSNLQLEKHFRNESEFYACECRMKHKNGSWVWVLDQGKVVEWDQEGKPVRMTGTHIDITEKKRYESLITAQRDMARHWSRSGSFREKLQACLDTAVQVSSMDCGGFYIANESGSSMSLEAHQGLSEGFIQKTSCFYHDSDNMKLIRSCQAIYTHHDKLSGSNDEIVLKEGLKAIAVIPVCHQNNIIGCLNIASHDQDEIPDHSRDALKAIADYTGSFVLQEMEEEKNRRLKNNLNMLFNTIQDMVLVFDQEGRIISHNAAALEILNIKDEELAGKTIFQIYPPESHDQLRQLMAKISSGKTGTFLIPLQTADQKEVPFETQSQKGYWDGRDAILSISRDISERLAIEQKKQQLEKAASLSRMAGAIAHRFNNMLAVISGNLELAMDDLSDQPEIRRNVLEAFKACREAAHLSGMMLLYLGQTMDRFEPIALYQSIQKILSGLNSELGVQLTLSSPSVSPRLTISSNADLIHHILRNLITNALDAAPERGGEIRISLETVSREQMRQIPMENFSSIDYGNLDESYVCLSVKDNGHGIGKEEMNRIFDPFFSTRFIGRGMGLAIVQSIVRAHKGLIAVTSRPEGGDTLFRIFFPVLTDGLSPA